jgi:hypothetical protein
MAGIERHDAFVPAGTKAAPLPAVTVGPEAVWGHVYNAVTTKSARLVQGGGCLTVGVAGLVLGGGFGSYSRLFGTAAASLLEAEIVTADGAVRIANAAINPDLFWALKGGGGGTFGVVTRLTLRTHELPATAGFVNATIHAHSDAAFRSLIGRFVAFYAERLATERHRHNQPQQPTGSGPLPRGQVVSRIWEYIRSHNLQNPENRREIVADDQLRRVFGRTR